MGLEFLVFHLEKTDGLDASQSDGQSLIVEMFEMASL